MSRAKILAKRRERGAVRQTRNERGVIRRAVLERRTRAYLAAKRAELQAERRALKGDLLDGWAKSWPRRKKIKREIAAGGSGRPRRVSAALVF